MPHSFSRVAILVAGLLLTAVCHAQSPQFGAWRKVSDSLLDKPFQFSMLPAAPHRPGVRLLRAWPAGPMNLDDEMGVWRV